MSLIKANSIPNYELCKACIMVRQCEREREKRVLDTRKRIIKDAKKLTLHTDNVNKGIYYQTKAALKRGLAHAYTKEEANMFEWLPKNLNALRFIRFSPLGEGKDLTSAKDAANIAKKKARGVTGYNVYEIKVDNILWSVKTEIVKGKAETAYIIMKKG